MARIFGAPLKVPAGKVARGQTKELHDLFRKRFSSTCCRVLTRNIRQDPKAHYRQCATFTGAAAEMTARLILQQRKELLASVDSRYLSGRESVLTSGLKKAVRLVVPRAFTDTGGT